MRKNSRAPRRLAPGKVVLQFDPALDRLPSGKRLSEGVSAAAPAGDGLWVAHDEAVAVDVPARRDHGGGSRAVLVAPSLPAARLRATVRRPEARGGSRGPRVRRRATVGRRLARGAPRTRGGWKRSRRDRVDGASAARGQPASHRVHSGPGRVARPQERLVARRAPARRPQARRADARVAWRSPPRAVPRASEQGQRLRHRGGRRRAGRTATAARAARPGHRRLGVRARRRAAPARRDARASWRSSAIASTSSTSPARESATCASRGATFWC